MQSNVIDNVTFTNAFEDSDASQDFEFMDTYAVFPLENGMYHYVGHHGDFVFDPKEFEVQAVDSDDGRFCAGGRSHIIRYIGSETDGAKIQIPKGVTDATLMFANTDVTSMPHLPDGLVSADGMFMGSKLGSVYQGAVSKFSHRGLFPPSLKSANFMFTQCHDLTVGPQVLPGSIITANYMFTGCEALKNTPKLSGGLIAGDSMFAGCHSLTMKPKKPGSMKYSEDLTYDCPGIDRQETMQTAKQIAKAREKYEKKINRPTFRQKMGSAFTCMLQVHMMRQMGFGMVMAPLTVHMMRKTGAFKKDFTQGASQVLCSQKNGLARMAGKKIGKMGADYGEKLSQKRTDQMAAWDAMHRDAGAKGSLSDKTMAYFARRDYQSGLFRQILHVNGSERQVISERYSSGCQSREAYLAKLDGGRGLTKADKERVADWYVEQLSGCSVYYAEGKRQIDSGTYQNRSEQLFVQSGLDEVSRLQVDELLASAERLQNQYQIFTDKDLRMITRMVESLPSESGKQGTFAQRNRAGNKEMGEKVRQAFTNMGQDYQESLQKEASKKQQQTSQNRNYGERAANHFGRAAADFVRHASEQMSGFGMGE